MARQAKGRRRAASAFRLSLDEIAQVENLPPLLRDAHLVIVAEIAAYNEAMREAFAAVRDAVDAYNVHAAEAETMREAIAERVREAFEDKSLRWQESDAGEAASEFAAAWEGEAFEGIEIDEPADLDEPDERIADLLAEFPVEAGDVSEPED